MTVNVEIKQLSHGADLPLPSYATEGSAGMDLMSAENDVVTLYPGEHKLIATGVSIALPTGFEAQIRPRSGLAAKHGITVLNSPGTIDADYRGEVKVILINHGKVTFEITRAMRIAQMIIAPVTQAKWQAVDVLSETVRGEGGFGSTGTATAAA